MEFLVPYCEKTFRVRFRQVTVSINNEKNQGDKVPCVIYVDVYPVVVKICVNHLRDVE